jgi:hypothetical protein
MNLAFWILGAIIVIIICIICWECLVPTNIPINSEWQIVNEPDNPFMQPVTTRCKITNIKKNHKTGAYWVEYVFQGGDGEWMNIKNYLKLYTFLDIYERVK